AAAPGACASHSLPAPARDGGRARASSPPEWRSPRHAGARPRRCPRRSSPLWLTFRAAALALRRHHTTGFVAGDKAAVIARLLLLLLRAGVNRIEIADRPIRQVRSDHVTDAAVRRASETVDLPLERRLHLQDRLAQRLAFDEIIRKLVERSVEIIVGENIAFERADQNFPLEPMILVEGKSGALADQDAAGLLRGEERVGDLLGLVEDVVEDLVFGIVDEEKTDRGFIEDRPDEGLVRPERARRRLYAAQVVERKHDTLALVGDAIDQRLDLLHRDALRRIQDRVLHGRIVVPLRGVLEIGEDHLALVAIARIEPDVAGIADAVVHEAEVVIVLGRIDRHAL